MIALGLWRAAGQTDQVEAGTFMHELGHGNGLTHGGLYYDTPGTYVPTFEPNCKPNYQSVMSYQFQIDLLDNGVLDYSEQQLSPLNESTLPAGVTTHQRVRRSPIRPRSGIRRLNPMALAQRRRTTVMVRRYRQVT